MAGPPSVNSTTSANGGGNPRIPMALQQVFVASQRGDDVAQIEAPKSPGIGFKIFKRAFHGFRTKKNQKALQKQQLQRAPSLSSLNSETSRPKTGKSPDNSSEFYTTTTKKKMTNNNNNNNNSSVSQAPSKPSSFSTRNSSGTVSTSASAAARPTAADATRLAMKENPLEKKQIDIESPQVYLDKMLLSRGYSTKKYCSLEGGYYCRPTPLQQASYGVRISQAIRSSDTTLLRRLLDSGLSSNPCNNFGESLIHMVCRRGDAKILRILLESGCSLQVTDDYGRTPLHDACWRATPSFDTVQLILDSDIYLLQLLDCRGAAPLSYVKKENYAVWITFLQSKLDRFWPIRDVNTEGEERPPPLTIRPPHSLPIPDPPHGLPIEVATMVANGRMEPEEALYLDDDSDSDSDDDSSYDSDDDDSYDSDDDDGSDLSDDDSDFDKEEMAEFCMRAGGPMLIAQKAFGQNVQVLGTGIKNA